MSTKKKNLVLGIFIDGYRLSCALLGKSAAHIQIEMLENFDLEDQLLTQGSNLADHKLFEAQTKSVAAGKKDNPFDLSIEFSRKNEKSSIASQTKTNVDVILQMLAVMCPPDTRLAFNLIDTFVLYKLYPGLRERMS